MTRAVEGRDGDHSSALTVTFEDSTFTGSFADGDNGLWSVLNLDYTDASGEQSNLNGNYYNGINNWGINATFADDATWYVTNDSYLGSLTIENANSIKTTNGKNVKMTVNGVETPIEVGTYEGEIIITLY